MMYVAALIIVREEKRAIFSRFQRGEDTLPAARLCPIGTLRRFADAAAPGTCHRDGPIGSRQHEARGCGAGRRGDRRRNGAGLGTGSTAAFAIEALAARVEKGLRIVGIATSEKTAVLARRLGVPLTSFAEHRHIDLTIDGAGQVDTLHPQLRRRPTAREDRGEREPVVLSSLSTRQNSVDRLGEPLRRYRSRSCGSGGRPCSTDWAQSAARRGCASLAISRSSRTAATTSSIAPLRRSRIQRRWRRGLRPSLVSSRVASLSTWHPGLWSADRLAQRYLRGEELQMCNGQW